MTGQTSQDAAKAAAAGTPIAQPHHVATPSQVPGAPAAAMDPEIPGLAPPAFTAESVQPSPTGVPLVDADSRSAPSSVMQQPPLLGASSADGDQSPVLRPPSAGASASTAAPVSPATTPGMGRMAPPTPAAVPTLDPGEDNSAARGLGRAMPTSHDVGEVKIGSQETDESAYQRASTEAKSEEHDISLPEVLDTMMEMGASDLHLTANARPAVRVHGGLKQLDNFPVLEPDMIQRVIYGALTQGQREKFEENLELDFSYTLPGSGRFRVNVYRQREALGAAFRMIPFEIKPLEELGVPPAVRDFAAQPRGFVLVTGPTGSGKSTTLASLIDHANETRDEHIMTVEDPIEFLHEHKNCLVNQREVGEDTWSFGAALKHVLRQDPDIILVGEMRDLETIQVALTAAETGHLVFATLHTQDAAQTIDRVIDVFPPHQQQQVRQQLAGALQGVVCQTLCKTKDGKGRAVATEVLVVTPAVRNLIREGKTHQIYSSMQAGAKHGMHTMDQHLAQLVSQGKISYEVGVEKCHHLEDFNRLCGRS